MNTVNALIKRLGQFVCRYRGTHVAEYIAASSDLFNRALGNEKFEMEHNGELRALKIVSTFNPGVIFDVGANIGNWSRIASSMNPSCQIYAFEVVPTTFEKFEGSTRDIENIYRINKGLSDSSGKIEIRIGANSSIATGTGTGTGFRVGKIYPRVVDFFEYHPKRENFRGSNFIAVQKNDRDLIDALAAFAES